MKLCQGKSRPDMKTRFFTEQAPAEKWSQHQACQSSRRVWTTFLVECLVSGSPVRSRVLDSTSLMGLVQLD